MKLFEYYATHFEQHGDLKLLKHPYFDLHIPSDKPCFFNKVCKSNNTFIAMSSRNKNKFENYNICLSCSRNYFTSWNQPNMIEYHYHAYGVDLDADVPKEIPNMNQFVKGEVYRVIEFGEVHEMTLLDAELVMEKDEFFYMLSFNKVFAWFDKDLVSRGGTIKVLM